jgi:hypothetical protein
LRADLAEFLVLRERPAAFAKGAEHIAGRVGPQDAAPDGGEAGVAEPCAAAMKAGIREAVGAMIARETATRTVPPSERVGYAAAARWLT